jgi:hypothetical protein
MNKKTAVVPAGFVAWVMLPAGRQTTSARKKGTAC